MNNAFFIKVLDDIDIYKTVSSYPEEVWYQGQVAESRYKHVDGLEKVTDLRDADCTGTCEVLQKFIADVLDPIVDEYAKNNGIDVSDKDYQSVRYSKGQFFKEHADATEEFPRKFSVLLYLNDDYSGGEVVFTKFNMSIKPKKNTLIIFPSSEEFSHSASPVDSGIKYVVVGFVS